MVGTLVILIAIGLALLVLLRYRLAVLKLRLEHVASQNRQTTTIRVECERHETADPATESAVIRVNCPRCGDLDLTSCMVRLMICQKLPHEMRYSFMCWRCDEDVVKSAIPSVVLLLLAAGVRPEYVTVDEVLMMEMSEVLGALGTVATMPSHEIWRRLGADPL